MTDPTLAPLDPGDDAGTSPGKAAEARSFDPAQETLSDLIRAAAEPLLEIDDPLFAIQFDRFADARVVLIGEASHGTSEFYRARAAITRRLIEEHGFNIVAVEADWPDAALIGRYVRHKGLPANAEPAFQRFPTWMWRNAEVQGFVQWLHDYNMLRPDSRRAGFYGLDLYNLSASMRAVVDYLDEVDPEAAAVARERYGCLVPWASDPQAYGRVAISEGYTACEAAVTRMLTELLSKRLDYATGLDPEASDAFLNAEGNARLVRDAEAYYRAIYYGSAASWNLRDSHMFETLESLLAWKGVSARAVVWAHNSHIGDARFTDMGVNREELNIGQLCKQRHGDRARLIGLGTHTGTVAAADDWDAPMEVKRVNLSRPDSYERACHDSGVKRFLLDLREGEKPQARAALMEPRLERFIGVIYRPQTERWSHYSECRLARQYDAWVWFDETRAVTPLDAAAPSRGPDDTWPFGL